MKGFNFKSQSWLCLLLVMFVSGFFLTACEPPEVATNAEPSSSISTPTPTPVASSSNQNFMNLPKLQGKAVVEMKVNGGTILIELDGDNAPITAGNFVDLVERGVYNGLVFHRVISDPQPFVAQGGDPQGKDPKFPISRLGTGGFIDPATGKQRYIPLEIKLKDQAEPIYSQSLGRQGGYAEPPVVLHHSRGTIAMARSQAPDSASSQFYFSLADLAFLDGDYAVFGHVTQGMEVVDAIKQGDRIESAKVISGIENLKK